MSSEASPCDDYEWSFAQTQESLRTLKELFDYISGGSLIHFPAMSDTPNPEEDQMLVRIAMAWQIIVLSHPDYEDNEIMLAKYKEKWEPLDREVQRILARAFDPVQTLSEEQEFDVVMAKMYGMLYQQAYLVEKMTEMTTAILPAIQKLEGEAMTALKAEMLRW